MTAALILFSAVVAEAAKWRNTPEPSLEIQVAFLRRSCSEPFLRELPHP